LRRELRIEQGHDDHVEHIQAGEHDAGEESAGVELYHRDTGGGPVENEHDARRNQDAAGPQHRRIGEEAHQGDDCADDAGSGREDRAGGERRQRERSRHRTGGELQRAEQPVQDVGALDDVAHEHE
jgi:hypothetical protein